jgi:hypothetical protein
MIIPVATGLRPVDLDSECYFAETARKGAVATVRRPRTLF